MKTMTIFEPALCCETGICGVGVDPELLRISVVINALKKNGVEVKRFNLNNSPMEFVKNETINKLINEENGMDKLPAVILDGNAVITGRYPTNEEFVALLEVPEEYLTDAKADQGCCCEAETEEACCEPSESCCCPDGECC